VDRRAFSRVFEMLGRKLNDAFFKTFIYVFPNYFFKILLHTYLSPFSGSKGHFIYSSVSAQFLVRFITNPTSSADQ